MPDDAEAGRRAHQEERLDQAARAAWLYYIGGRTQDEIAAALNISRQAAQRLVSLALAEKLIRFRVDHPIAACMALGEALTARYRLRACEVVPDGGAGGALASVAVAGARLLERRFAQKAPLVLGVSTGQTLRAIAAELPPLAAPQHKVFSLCGIIARDGRAIAAEPVMQLAERTGAQCYPMPLPVVVATVEERRLLQSQRAYRTLRDLYAESRFFMLGVGHVGWRAPIHVSGCITDAELTELIEAGAVGEIAGRAFDSAGRLLATAINERVTGLSVTSAHAGVTVGVAAGPEKVAPLRAALQGGLINAVITDEPTARAILADGRTT
ncbi:MAG: sugar-binding transcriptional regulator [Rhodospirillales bacterium]|nr:sugar-binding transcriptional regulator [Rhodospirillales bacterium]